MVLFKTVILHLGILEVISNAPWLLCRYGIQYLYNPLPSVHSHTVAGLEAHSGVAAADDSGNAQLTGDDRGVGEGRTDVGDDSGRAGKERGPAHVGGNRHQDLTGLELVAILRAV
jgi:hypothetical protein